MKSKKDTAHICWKAEVRVAQKIVRRLAAAIGIADDDELCGAALLALLQCAKRFDRSHGVSFRTFAHRRIKGAVFDQLRQTHRVHKREVTPFDTFHEDDSEFADQLERFESASPSPLARLEQRSTRSELNKLVGELGVHEQAVIRLMYFADLTPGEAAEQLGNRSKAWISRYHRNGIEALREKLRVRGE